MNTPYDWTKFKKQSYIQASPQDVFDAWAKPGQIIEWFIAQADYSAPDGELRSPQETVQLGDHYFWRWHQGSDISGEVLEVIDGKKLQFTFGGKQEGSDQAIVVTVEVSESEPGITSLELTQENIADTPEAHVQWHLSCNQGWTFFIANLKAWIEHGVDLREQTQEKAASSRAVSYAG